MNQRVIRRIVRLQQQLSSAFRSQLENRSGKGRERVRAKVNTVSAKGLDMELDVRRFEFRACLQETGPRLAAIVIGPVRDTNTATR